MRTLECINEPVFLPVPSTFGLFFIPGVRLQDTYKSMINLLGHPVAAKDFLQDILNQNVERYITLQVNAGLPKTMVIWRYDDLHLALKYTLYMEHQM